MAIGDIHALESGSTAAGTGSIRLGTKPDLSLTRTGRALREPGRHAGQRKNRIPDIVNIAERPPEADNRAVPGHWEGDVLIGTRNATAIGPLVERSSDYAMLMALRDGHKPEHLAPAVQTLPDALRR